MAHQLETAAAAAIQNESKLRSEVTVLKDMVSQGEQKIAALQGKIEALERELSNSQTRSDHYLRWNAEITMQMHNIHMFVQDAMEQARINVKGNGQEQPQAMLSVEKAIKDMKNDPLQPKDVDRRIPNNEVR
jgi:hypothetical protein